MKNFEKEFDRRWTERWNKIGENIGNVFCVLMAIGFFILIGYMIGIN